MVREYLNTPKGKIMSEEHWGVKRTCPSCPNEVRFYDLNKDPMVCPICQNTFSLESILDNFKKPTKEVTKSKVAEEATTEEIDDIEAEDDIILDETESTVMEDDILDEDDEDSSPIDAIADVKKDEDEA